MMDDAATKGPVVMLKKMIRAAAFHEAGHAVAASLLGNDIVNALVNIDARTIREITGDDTRQDPC
jgi:ATP-dependent Zn protease